MRYSKFWRSPSPPQGSASKRSWKEEGLVHDDKLIDAEVLLMVCVFAVIVVLLVLFA